MQLILLILLALLSAALGLLLRKKNVQLRALSAQLHQLQARTEQAEQLAHRMQAGRDALWTDANTIHLYASLTREESSCPSIREKQTQILRSCEEILRSM